MAEYELTIEKTLDATPAQLFRTWTDAESIKQWWAPGPYERPNAKSTFAPAAASSRG